MPDPLPYPETLPEFQRMFPDDAACEAYLFALRWPEGYVCPECQGEKFWGHTRRFALRWPEGYVCPECQGEKFWGHTRRLVQCAACGEQTSLTAGTIMHKTHTPLLTWFYGAFLVTTLTPGISGVQFQKHLGIKRNETAFQILHKLRAAMVDPLRGRLEGIVEVDETYVGGERHGVPGGRTHVPGRVIVAGAVEVRERKSAKRGRSTHYAGRLRFRAVEDASGASLEGFVVANVTPGATVRTDGWAGYAGLGALGYAHVAVVQGAPVLATKHLPLIHREFSNLKTWLDGTHHGRVEPQYLQAYLNEFVFRHNRRFWPFSAFQTVLRLGMSTDAPTYDELYAAEGLGRGVHPNRRAAGSRG